MKHQEKSYDQERRQEYPGRGLKPDVVKKKLAHGCLGAMAQLCKQDFLSKKRNLMFFPEMYKGAAYPMEYWFLNRAKQRKRNISTCTIEISFWLCVARSEVRRAWESLVLRPTPTLRFGRATRKCKMNRTGRNILSKWLRTKSQIVAFFGIPTFYDKCKAIII